MPKFSIPERELVYSGHVACPGCGGGLAIRYLLKALGPKTVMSIPACCWAIVSGAFPRTCLAVPTIDTAFEATGASVSGLRAALDAMDVKDVTVVGLVGSRLSRILTRQCTAVVNVPVLKDHSIAGISVSLKNFFGFFTRIGFPSLCSKGPLWCSQSIPTPGTGP